MHGTHCVKSWSITQATIALSSAEAELYALLRATTQTLGLIAIGKDLGVTLNAAVHTDASATLGIINRQGLGKLRHIGVQYLWMQEKVKNGDVSVLKVPGAENPADLCTKYLAAHTIEQLTARIGVQGTSDRASTAPQLSSLATSPEAEGGPDEWLRTGQQVERHHAKPRRIDFTP